MYYVAIDGGGTKTAFGLFDKEGDLLDKIELSTSHFLQVGYKGCAKCLSKGIQHLVDKYHIDSKEICIGIGIAGYGNEENVRKQLEMHIHEQINEYQYVLTNDMHIALIGALDGKDGIVVVAGTGAIAMAQKDKQVIRCGGWGYQLGDEGSAYWIGKQFLFHFCKQADGREDKDELYDMVMGIYHMNNPYEIITVMNEFENERTEVAKLAKICDELSQTNKTCQNILQEAGFHIACLVKGLQKHFDNIPLVTYYGSVFHSEYMKESFYHHVKDCQIIISQHDALYGAYLYAKQNYRYKTIKGTTSEK